jgi:hypothetical protein
MLNNRKEKQMSTRAVYTFKDATNEHHVYKHHDGYPKGAMQFIWKTINKAWPLPRFEADEFAAAFIAANKEDAGGVRLTKGPESHGDLDYRYEVKMKDGSLHIKIFENNNGFKLKEEGYANDLFLKYYFLNT